MSIRLAVVGATGLVGQEVLKILDQRGIQVQSLKLLASKKSAGKTIYFRGEKYMIQEATPASFQDVEVAIFSAGTAISKTLIPEAVRRGTVVIDNSNAFRMEPKVPLVIPEVNSHEIEHHQGIIANPNCSTIQLVVALKPIYEYTRIKKIWIATYQSVSGSGQKGMEELLDLSQKSLNNEPCADSLNPHPIAFNLLPQIDIFLENDYTREEMKMVYETKKILADDQICIEATAVRVPVFVGHSEAITIETEDEITPSMARKLLSEAPGLIVLDDPSQNRYPTPRDVANQDHVYVGRIRKSLTAQNGLSMWVVGDNLRKGAALNAVQILEYLVQRSDSA